MKGSDHYIYPRNVDVQIRKIRKEIGQEKITTIKGVGYKFNSQ
ncbi:MAG: winged helix-turn-helix domain-containing protein [Bacteroidota bacterium]|nr:winged helix-turn-helix domain-containing protein [Bacteroidota bacterium]